jgi:hypothetical protein
MNNEIASHSPFYFVLRINGDINSTHRRYEDAVTAGLLLKHQSPHHNIEVCEIITAKASLNKF